MRDIHDYAVKAERFLSGMRSVEALRDDERTLLAVIRALAVIGEATKRIPDDFRKKHPEVPWRGMDGMRDKVIHGYFGVDVEVVWRPGGRGERTMRLEPKNAGTAHGQRPTVHG